MTIHAVGRFGDQEIQEIHLRLDNGASATILTWGATLRDLQIPLGNSSDAAIRRVVLGYADLENYRANPCYLGATAGRCCNRIANGRFEIDGHVYQLDLNEQQKAHLHGGEHGFSRQNWQIVAADASSVCLSLFSQDGDQHYPGNVRATCRYQLIADEAENGEKSTHLRIEMGAETDAPTLLNLTHHSYFNLSADNNADVREHFLHLNADFYTPADATLIPAGEILKVAGTPYDFSHLKRINESGIDYDTNYVLNKSCLKRIENQLSMPAARLVSPNKDLEMSLLTNQPGLMVYSGALLAPTTAGIGGQNHGAYRGLCLEAQGFPDAINQRHFPSTVLRPNEKYLNISEYVFRAVV